LATAAEAAASSAAVAVVVAVAVGAAVCAAGDAGADEGACAESAHPIDEVADAASKRTKVPARTERAIDLGPRV
jgi:hypothetical protein